MSKRNLTTSRDTIFGHVSRGTECRVCGRDVDDGRRTHCSDRCKEIADAVAQMLNWRPVAEKVKERDDHTCQQCGADAERARRAYYHVRNRILELVAPLKPEPGEYSRRYYHARNELEERYNLDHGGEFGVSLEVDHIERMADGGAVFDESNLQTLCSECHTEKTAAENSTRDVTPDDDIERLTLDDYL